MGITNFTMVVPTVHRPVLQSAIRGPPTRVGGWEVVGGRGWGRWGHRPVRGRPELGRRAGARQSQGVG